MSRARRVWGEDRADNRLWEKICEITSASVFWAPLWLVLGWLQFRGNAGVHAPSGGLADG